MSVGYGQVVNGVGGEIVVVYLKPSEFDFTSPLYLSPGGGISPSDKYGPVSGIFKKIPMPTTKARKRNTPLKMNSLFEP